MPRAAAPAVSAGRPLIFGRACRILVRAHGRVCSRKLMPWRGLALLSGAQQVRFSATQDSIAEEPVPSGFACGLLFPACGGAAAKRVSQPLAPPLWVPRFGTSRFDLSIRLGSQLPGLSLKSVPASVGAAPTIISLPPGAAPTAEMVHSLTASNTVPSVLTLSPPNSSCPSGCPAITMNSAVFDNNPLVSISICNGQRS